jgi:predicted DNA-binding protein
MGKRKNKKKQNSNTKELIKELAGKLGKNKAVSKPSIDENVEEKIEMQTNSIQDDELHSEKSVTSAINVKNYRERLKALGFKQVSIYLPPSTYEKLKFLRLHMNKSYADIIEKLIEEEYKSFRKRKDVNFIS